MPPLVPWLAEVVRTVPGLVRSYGVARAIDPRTRQRVILAVTEVNGSRSCAWVHGAWQDFLGGDGRGPDEAVLAYARECAVAGRPLDPAPLREVLPRPAVDAIRATVAQGEIGSLVGVTFEGLAARLSGRRPLEPVAALREMGTATVALPLAVPLLATGVAMRVVNRLAPPLPPVSTPPAGEANLLVHLIAQAVPTYLSNAVVRLVVLDLPFTVAVGLRSGRTAATLRIGRRRVEVVNGLAPDAMLVVEGDVEPLLKLATGKLARELTGIRVRPNP